MATLYNMQVWDGSPEGLRASFEEFAQVALVANMKAYKVGRTLRQQITDLTAERDKIVEQYAVRDSAGKVLTFANGEPNLTQEGKAAWQALMLETFECGTIAASEIRNKGEFPDGLLLALGDLFWDDTE